MRAAGFRILRFILGTFPVIELPLVGERLVLGRKEGLMADMRLAGPSSEIVDFGALECNEARARAPLRNHSLAPERLRPCGESGRAMLLGHHTDIGRRQEMLPGGPGQGNAGGLY